MRVNIYIRKENEEAWNNIKDKSGWVNGMLTPAQTKPKKAVEELKKLPQIKTADEIAIKAFNDEECQGHEVRMNCGLRNCKYA